MTAPSCIACGRSNPPAGVGQRGTSGWRCVDAKSCDLLQSAVIIRRDAERFPRSGHSQVRHALADRLERYAVAYTIPEPVTPQLTIPATCGGCGHLHTTVVQEGVWSVFHRCRVTGCECREFATSPTPPTPHTEGT